MTALSHVLMFLVAPAVIGTLIALAWESRR